MCLNYFSLTILLCSSLLRFVISSLNNNSYRRVLSPVYSGVLMHLFYNGPHI